MIPENQTCSSISYNSNPANERRASNQRLIIEEFEEFPGLEESPTEKFNTIDN
jgi:hypothetical protein